MRHAALGGSSLPGRRGKVPLPEELPARSAPAVESFGPWRCWARSPASCAIAGEAVKGVRVSACPEGLRSSRLCCRCWVDGQRRRRPLLDRHFRWHRLSRRRQVVVPGGGIGVNGELRHANVTEKVPLRVCGPHEWTMKQTAARIPPLALAVLGVAISSVSVLPLRSDGEHLRRAEVGLAPAVTR